jgi:hypothetical protein
VVTWVMPLQHPQQITPAARENVLEWLMSSLAPRQVRRGKSAKG